MNSKANPLYIRRSGVISYESCNLSNITDNSIQLVYAICLKYVIDFYKSFVTGQASKYV